MLCGLWSGLVSGFVSALTDGGLTCEGSVGAVFCFWMELFNVPTGFWAGRGGGLSWKVSEFEKKLVFTITYWEHYPINRCQNEHYECSLQKLHSMCAGLTWTGFAGDPDGGWSPWYTWFGDQASIAVHVALRLDWDVIWTTETLGLVNKISPSHSYYKCLIFYMTMEI